MSEARKHTPGPWHWRLSDNATPHIEHGDCLPDEIGMLKNRVCVMPSEIMHDYNSLANARLIAAAPEMLEALKVLCNFKRECPCEVSNEELAAWDKAYAAIGKAEGRAEG
jgi:hypothetical protein